MRLHELDPNTPFALPDDRKRKYTKLGGGPLGICWVLNPEGVCVQMAGKTGVVTAPAPKREVNTCTD